MGLPDASTAGNVHVGTIMKLCDEVAGVAAIRHCGLRVVRAGMDRMSSREAQLRRDNRLRERDQKRGTRRPGTELSRAGAWQDRSQEAIRRNFRAPAVSERETARIVRALGASAPADVAALTIAASSGT